MSRAGNRARAERAPARPRVLAAILGAVLAATVLVAGGPAASAHDTDDFETVALLSVPSATDFAWLPDGRMLFTQKGGRVALVDNLVLQPTPVLDITSIVCDEIERGLAGITVHPEFETNNWVYLYYTYNKNGNCGQSAITGPANRASRFTMVGNTLDPASELILFETPELYGSNHNSGYMEFGNDGFLYVSVGDGSAPRLWGRPQDPGYLLGKVVRITDDGDIPPGNPFTGADSADCSADGVIPAGSTATKCQQVFAMGLRNPFRMAFNPNVAGTEFFINDVGQANWEEINEGQIGADYGWPSREGPCVFGSETDCAVPAGKVDPLHWYSHNGGGSAVTGGAFVPDGLWPSDFDGTYIYGEYVLNKLFVLEPGGDDCRTCTPPTSAFIADEFSDDATRVIGLRFGPHGDSQALYALFGSSFQRIAYVGDANRTPVAQAVASPNAGDLPLSVQFTGSGSTDPDGDELSYLWDFGDGSTSSQADPSHLYTVAGTYTVTLTVDDGEGGVGVDTVRVDPGNNAPVVSIDAPTAAFTYGVGDVVTLTGSATDVEDGALPDAALTWEVVLHHNTHIHPFVAPTEGNNLTLTAPAPEDLYAAEDSYLEVILTATDSQGVATTVTRDVQPTKVDLTFETVPPGLDLLISGYTLPSPVTVTSWDGHAESVSAQTQDFGGQTYYWTGWSNGGPPSQVLVTSNPATYVATFSTTPPIRTITAGEGQVLEGDDGAVDLVIPVTLNAPSGLDVSADWRTVAGFGGSEVDDFVSTTGVVSFPAGETNASIVVPVNGDTMYEPDELVIVALSNPTNAAVGGFLGLGFGSILNDDQVPVITPGNAVVDEGDAGQVTVSVDITMPPSEVEASVSWTTNVLDASADDIVAASGTLTFAPGETLKTVQVDVVGDTTYEPDEIVAVALTNPTNATVGGLFGLGLIGITNDDPEPTAAPWWVGAVEADAGTTAHAVPVNLSNPSQDPVVLQWETLDNSATAPEDYVAASGTLTIPPGELSGVVMIDVVGDLQPEGQELVVVRFTNATGAQIGGFYGLGFVVIDDNEGAVD